MLNTGSRRKIAVLGTGNLLLRDEGVGVQVAHALKEVTFPGNTEIIVVDNGTLPDIPSSLEEVEKLIIVDAVRGGGEPGTIYRFRLEDVDTEKSIIPSLHQTVLLENLWLMQRLKQTPKDVVIIGIEPEDINIGLDLSLKLRQRFPDLIKVVRDEIDMECAVKGERKAEK